MKNVFSITVCREQGDALSAFVILTAKWRLLNTSIETNVNKAERIVRCICLLHSIIIDLEGTTHDPSVLQETSQIHVSRHARTNISDRSFSRSKKGATGVRNAFKAYFNGPTAAILPQNLQVYLRCVFTVAPHTGTSVLYKVYDK